MPQVTELPLGEGIPLWRWTRRMVCFSQKYSGGNYGNCIAISSFKFPFILAVFASIIYIAGEWEEIDENDWIVPLFQFAYFSTGFRC